MTELIIKVNAQLPNLTLAIDEKIKLSGITGIFGHSGAGKSTLLKAIAGLNDNVVGTILLADKTLLDSEQGINLAPHHRQVVGVFQQDLLFPHLNVLDNILFGRKRLSTPKFNEKALIEAAGIGQLLNQKVASLSGGERQKVAIVQAILAEPDLLILDEPVTALDGLNKQRILHLIKTLQRQTNMPILFVSHQIQEHQALCDKLYLIEQGKFIAHGDVASLIHQLNNDGQIAPQSCFSARVLATQPHGLVELSLADGIHLFGMDNKLQLSEVTIQCYLLASDVSVCTEPPHHSSIVNQLPGTIDSITIKEHQALLTVNCREQIFYSAISTYSLNKLQLQQGSDIYIQFKASAIQQINF